MVSNKEQEAMMSAGHYLKPEKEPIERQIQKFIYNKDTGAYLGRTPMSWVKIILFYIIFYICLAALFAFLMLVLHYTLDPRIPKYKMDSSLIGTNPGLGFRPMPNDSNSLSSLIYYKGTRREDYAMWVDRLREFLVEYKTPGTVAGRGQNQWNCDYGTDVPPGKVCNFDVTKLYPCVEENNFNYHLQQPCVFLKLNKIYGWKPEPYGMDDLPAKMPNQLKNSIQSQTDRNRLNTVWLSCEGETPADVENVGNITYVPQQGFPGYFFPYMNNEGYLSPIVGIVFNNPKTGILLNIECKAWARNIEHSKKDMLGSVHFELMID